MPDSERSAQRSFSAVPRSLAGLRVFLRLDETGQMSIFIALIFQVLFVFFAMVVNVGLLVHDKINLQNAVDLGAYYAAQRQAEILNEIAHINYQIRQDYKLLVWRHRVLGTVGRHGNTNNPGENTLPPARKTNPGALTDVEWINPDYGQEDASVCVANNLWSDFIKDSAEEENMCFTPYRSKIPKIPDLPVIAPFVPGTGASAAFNRAAQAAQLASCLKAGPLNWAFTMQMIHAYKIAIATRKSLIWELRKNLISNDITDRSRQPVRDGVRKTIEKNLTYANAISFQNTEIEMINGLADPNCNRGDDGEFIFPEIRIAPVILYTGYDCQDGTIPEMRSQEVTAGLDPGVMNDFDPTGVMQNLAKGEPEPTNPLHSSLGFEKNPWCMAYMGVRARTQVRKPFAPFGQPIQLEARAFAQPFGGRIGPWYRERWTRGAVASTEGDRVDPLTSTRLLSGGGLDGNAQARQINFSRYPGDQLGLKSALSMGAQNNTVRGYGPPKPKGQRLQLSYYSQFDSTPSVGDVLAADGANLDLPIRRAEMAAVAPDLFDITYYSIDPNYMSVYAGLAAPDRFTGIPPVFGQPVQQIPDAGGRLDNAAVKNWNTSQQIQNAVEGGGLDPTILPKLYYVVRKWEHLLTGWASAGVQDFTFPANRFGQCQGVGSESVPVPGRCWVMGGRTGYSVRLISRSHLTSPTWRIGGEGEAEGGILNPPPPSF